ncbi:MAG: hypothetical protein GW938_16610 [Leptospira sp.]|nr:hypothetical protein [Leptospira sp.]NCS94558.1 hypothetical protein [Leptospira sp.]
MRMQISKWSIILIVLAGSHPVYSNYLGYGKIEPILKKTWNEQYPIPYDRIKKKNINGKGILKYRKDRKLVYIYTFIVFFSHHKVVDKKITDDKGGRDIIVKLYYDPNLKANQYWIEMGELDEEYDRGNFLGYTN